MNVSGRSRDVGSSDKIIVALIGALALVVAALISIFPSILNFFFTDFSESNLDNSNSSIHQESPSASTNCWLSIQDSYIAGSGGRSLSTGTYGTSVTSRITLHGSAEGFELLRVNKEHEVKIGEVLTENVQPMDIELPWGYDLIARVICKDNSGCDGACDVTITKINNWFEIPVACSPNPDPL